MADIAVLLREGKYSDLVLKCQEETFRVHRSIICAQSPVFAAATDGEFKESITNEIEVTQFEPEIVKLMLDFLYTGDYACLEQAKDSSEQCGESPDKPSPLPEKPEEIALARAKAELTPHIKVNTIGNYYQILKLADLATTKTQDILDDVYLDMPPELLSQVIKQAFDLSGDALLHEVVAGAAADDIDELIQCDEFRNLEGLGDAGLAIIDRLDTRISDLEVKISEGEQRELDLKASIRSKDAKLKTLGRAKSCRSCSTTFNSYLERNTNGNEADSHYIRCKGCKAKNFGPQN